MSGFQVGVTALRGPTQRLKTIGTDLGMASSGAATAAASGSAAAGSPAVTSAADVFKAGVQSVLAALADDAGLLGDKVQKAGVTYEAVDRTAMPTGTGSGNGPGAGPGGGDSGGGDSGGGDSGGGGPPAEPETVPVAAGDSLWGIAASRLGPDASNAKLAAEVDRWYEANRDRIGPDRLLNEGSTLRAPEEARTGG